MSQNLEKLFALEGGAKRRVAKKGSKKASKGKKGMKGGANRNVDECLAGIGERSDGINGKDVRVNCGMIRDQDAAQKAAWEKAKKSYRQATLDSCATQDGFNVRLGLEKKMAANPASCSTIAGVPALTADEVVARAQQLRRQ